MLHPRAFRMVRRAAWFVGGLITLAAAHMHWVFLTHAEGLWRDEAGLVRLATFPSWKEVWEMLPHDHCPILLPALVRTWVKAGFGQTDFELRVLGFCLGLLLPICFWVASRIMRKGVPLLPLALVALNATVIRTGDSFRGYGLGGTLNVLLFALTWQVVQKPAFLSSLLASLVAVLSVQCFYQNAFFVFAACIAGVVVCATGRRWRSALWTVGIGLTAAVSLIPYLPIIRRAQDSYLLEKIGFRFSLGWETISHAIDFPLPGFKWLWVALVLLAIWVGISTTLRSAGPTQDFVHREVVLFGTTALIVCLPSFAIFLKLAELPTQPWYYVPLMAFVVVCLDVVLSSSSKWVSSLLAMVALVAAAIAYPVGLPEMKCRQTNMDQIATRLNKEAASGDYIIVHPWYCGVSFARYYQGTAPWTTLPQLDDHQVHRYDLLKIKMQMEDPLQPVLEKVSATLQSSHRVWIVGWIPLDEKPPPYLRPAPNDRWGWLDGPYSQVWGAQIGYFIVTHASRRGIFPIPSANCVNSFENLPVLLVTGWH